MLELSIEGNNLSGSIPPEIGNLTYLEALSIEGNNLSGDIPPEIGNLSRLSMLSFGVDNLNGCVPSHLNHIFIQNDAGLPLCGESTATPMTQPTAPGAPSQSHANADTEREALIALYNAMNGPSWYIQDNWLTDLPVGDWHGVKTRDGRVVELSLYNNLSGSIPPEIGNLSNLRALSFYSNNLNGSIPPEIGNLSNLMELDLSMNNLSGSIPPEIGDLSNLQLLWLEGNNLSGCLPSSMMSALRSFDDAVPFCD